MHTNSLDETKWYLVHTITNYAREWPQPATAADADAVYRESVVTSAVASSSVSSKPGHTKLKTCEFTPELGMQMMLATCRGVTPAKAALITDMYPTMQALMSVLHAGHSAALRANEVAEQKSPKKNQGDKAYYAALCDVCFGGANDTDNDSEETSTETTDDTVTTTTTNSTTTSSHSKKAKSRIMTPAFFTPFAKTLGFGVHGTDK
jgi:hypothetical protein